MNVFKQTVNLWTITTSHWRRNNCYCSPSFRKKRSYLQHWSARLGCPII